MGDRTGEVLKSKNKKLEVRDHAALATTHTSSKHFSPKVHVYDQMSPFLEKIHSGNHVVFPPPSKNHKRGVSKLCIHRSPDVYKALFPNLNYPTPSSRTLPQHLPYTKIYTRKPPCRRNQHQVQPPLIRQLQQHQTTNNASRTPTRSKTTADISPCTTSARLRSSARGTVMENRPFVTPRMLC